MKRPIALSGGLLFVMAIMAVARRKGSGESSGKEVMFQSKPA